MEQNPVAAFLFEVRTYSVPASPIQIVIRILPVTDGLPNRHNALVLVIAKRYKYVNRSDAFFITTYDFRFVFTGVHKILFSRSLAFAGGAINENGEKMKKDGCVFHKGKEAAAELFHKILVRLFKFTLLAIQFQNIVFYQPKFRYLREGLFIKKNKARWEKIGQGGVTDADETAKDFVQLVDDLSYAKTYYPTSRVTKYINGLATKIYLGIYQNRKEESNRLLRFWQYDVPMAVYRNRRVILFSFFVFALFYTVGFFTAKNDPSFIREVFGNRYVDETEKNIDSGNPFGIYGSGDSFFMWIYIMINNIMVSFMYFGKGILLGIFSLLSLGKESMRVGVFNYMFFEKGQGAEFVLAVMIHGLLELAAIVMACGAGAVMGTSYLFPGTRSRLSAFKDGVKDGVKILVGLIPILMLAAFYEGFVTRYYKMPLPLNILILASSAALLIFYFVVYPLKLKKRERAQHA